MENSQTRPPGYESQRLEETFDRLAEILVPEQGKSKLWLKIFRVGWVYIAYSVYVDTPGGQTDGQTNRTQLYDDKW